MTKLKTHLSNSMIQSEWKKKKKDCHVPGSKKITHT